MNIPRHAVKLLLLPLCLFSLLVFTGNAVGQGEALISSDSPCCTSLIAIYQSISVQITVIVIAVVILVIIMAAFLFLQVRLNAIIGKCCEKSCCCCCCKDDVPGEDCFELFDVTYTTRQPPGATVPLYDIVINWSSGADLVDIEYQVARSGGWVKMGNQSPPEMFIDLPPTDTRTWTHVTGYALIDCGEVIQIRGVCKSSSGAILGYSAPTQQIVLPCP